MSQTRKRDKAGRLLKRIFVSEEQSYEYHMPASEPLLHDKTVGDSLADSARHFAKHMRRNSSFFRQSSVAYAISILAGLFAGIFLGHYEEMLIALPGLIVLVPAAIEEVITRKNAYNIKAKIILEMANGPTDSEADKILTNKDVIIIPDILANSGGVATSFFEWFQNINDEKWEKEKVLKKLKDKMEKAVLEVIKIARERKTSLRDAAYILALRRIEVQWSKSRKKIAQM